MPYRCWRWPSLVCPGYDGKLHPRYTEATDRRRVGGLVGYYCVIPQTPRARDGTDRARKCDRVQTPEIWGRAERMVVAIAPRFPGPTDKATAAYAAGDGTGRAPCAPAQGKSDEGAATGNGLLGLRSSSKGTSSIRRLPRDENMM